MRGLSSWIRSHPKPMRSSAPGAKVLHQHVASLDEFFQYLFADRIFGVEFDRPLVVIEHGEIERICAWHIDQLLACGIADARALNLDDIGTKPGQELRAGGAGLNMGEIKDPDTFERFLHDVFSDNYECSRSRSFLADNALRIEIANAPALRA